VTHDYIRITTRHDHELIRRDISEGAPLHKGVPRPQIVIKYGGAADAGRGAPEAVRARTVVILKIRG